MKTIKMIATSTLLIAGILINQAFAQTAQNATANTQKNPKTELKTSNSVAPLSVNQKAPEAKAVNSQPQAAKPATQATPAGSKDVKSNATAMNKEVSAKHHRGHKANKRAKSSMNKPAKKAGKTS
jgi:hypothetical protein